MCWSGPASAGMATLGIGGALLAKIKNEHPFRYINIAYFSLMELLQALTYSVIGICSITEASGGKWNETLTYLSYIHICIQPIFLNLAGISYSVTQNNLKKVLKIIMPISFILVFLMLSKMFFHNYFGECNIDTYSCGRDTCSYYGNWHIAWRFYLNALDEFNFFGLKTEWLLYNISFFILPLFYGGWRWSLYNLFFALFTRSLSNNKDEFPAIWCISSVALLLIVYIPFIRNWIEIPIRKKI